jgi:hypothetical protein
LCNTMGVGGGGWGATITPLSTLLHQLKPPPHRLRTYFITHFASIFTRTWRENESQNATRSKLQPHTTPARVMRPKAREGAAMGGGSKLQPRGKCHTAEGQRGRGHGRGEQATTPRQESHGRRPERARPWEGGASYNPSTHTHTHTSSMVQSMVQYCQMHAEPAAGRACARHGGGGGGGGAPPTPSSPTSSHLTPHGDGAAPTPSCALPSPSRPTAPWTHRGEKGRGALCLAHGARSAGSTEHRTDTRTLTLTCAVQGEWAAWDTDPSPFVSRTAPHRTPPYPPHGTPPYPPHLTLSRLVDTPSTWGVSLRGVASGVWPSCLVLPSLLTTPYCPPSSPPRTALPPHHPVLRACGAVRYTSVSYCLRTYLLTYLLTYVYCVRAVQCGTRPSPRAWAEGWGRAWAEGWGRAWHQPDVSPHVPLGEMGLRWGAML